MSKESSMTAAARVYYAHWSDMHDCVAPDSTATAVVKRTDFDALARERDELRNLHRLACNLAVERYEQLEQAKQRVEALEAGLLACVTVWDKLYPLLPRGDEFEDAEFGEFNRARALSASSAKGKM